MDSWVNNFFFGIYPYIALGVLALGSIIRFDREQYTWRAGSSQMLRRRQLTIGSNLFHIGVLIIFFGHLAGLLTPIALFDWLGVSHSSKQLMAIILGGGAGIICFIGITMLLHRRLFDPRIRATSTFGDTSILILLYAQLILGLSTIPLSMGHLSGDEMIKFMSWAQGIFTFKAGAAAFISDVHIIFKAHLVLGLTIFLVFPFTRLVHMLSAPVGYLGRKGYQIVRTKKQNS
jgi:nitrate reductase gamma subunit